LRILQISSARSFGGGERHLIDLTKGLVQRGHEVYLALSPLSPLQKKLAEILPEENLFNVSMRNALDLLSARALARLVREREIEIVHAHMGRDYPLAAFAVRKSKAKLVITRHVLFPLSRLHKFTLSNLSRVIAVSKAVERNLIEQKIFPTEKICVVPNGIDFEKFDTMTNEADRKTFRRQLNLSEESLLVGSIGELKFLKGHDILLRAAARLVWQFDNIHFVIAGGGEGHKDFERLVHELKIEGRVYFLGRVEDVGPMLRAVDVFVSASRVESFGLAIVEAMACGAPVIATRTEGASEVIEDEKTGLLVPVGNVEAIARAVEFLLNDKEKIDSLVNAARRAARENYTIEAMIKATERVYRNALAWS
jgi:glycosyltransferase involved in cell wall biosynthesis